AASHRAATTASRSAKRARSGSSAGGAVAPRTSRSFLRRCVEACARHAPLPRRVRAARGAGRGPGAGERAELTLGAAKAAPPPHTSSTHELVAEAVDREDVPRLLGPRLHLLAQLHDEVVDGAVVRGRLDAPHLVEELVAAHRLAGALVQELEELHLVERELRLAAAAAQHLRGGIDLRVADADRRVLLRRAVHAAEDRADA